MLKRLLSVFIVVTFLFEIYKYAEVIEGLKELNDWVGYYTYTYSDESEDIYVEFSIRIYNDGRKYYAEIENWGIFSQIGYFYSRSLAYIKGNTNSIDISFRSTLPGDSLYGTEERFDKRELMITMEHTDNDSRLYSTWYVLNRESPIVLNMKKQ